MGKITALIFTLLACPCARGQAEFTLLAIEPRAGSQEFSPSYPSGLFAWYKSDALVTNVSDVSPPLNNETVRTWGDSSGNQRHLTTNNPTAVGPVWNSAATTGKGQGGLEFSDASRIRVGFTALPDTTIFIVWRINGLVGTFGIPLDSTNASARQVVYKNSGNAFAIASATEQAGGTVVNAAWYVQTAVFNSGGNDALYTNGVAVSTSLTAGSQSLDGLTVGSSNSGAASPGNDSWIGEILIYNRSNMSAGELNAVHTYLIGRWSP